MFSERNNSSQTKRDLKGKTKMHLGLYMQSCLWARQWKISVKLKPKRCGKSMGVRGHKQSVIHQREDGVSSASVNAVRSRYGLQKVRFVRDLGDVQSCLGFSQ